MIYPDEATLLAEAKHLVEKWQPLLLLHEWEISVQTGELEEDSDTEFRCAESDFWSRTRLGCITFDLPYWSGKRERATAASKTENHSLEVTVCHELLHIRMADWRSEYIPLFDSASQTNGQNARHEEEKFVNIMARILVDLEAKASH